MAVAAVLVAIGVFVALAAAVTVLFGRTALGRLHFVTPVTSVAGPLIGLGLAIANGFSLTSATIVLTVAIMAVTGPILTAATGRMARDTERRT
ncbi:monovalent cation/H(+) antiporter subunit G [Fodinicola acaciae]|uniref:monovalent cation/H(+) antiporter subunit G n=1 Tax=Fodinicola acaciae TaxID=2681555 RepID=UPI001C9E954E|nr:monovalent cation/H(+) antiporter subunit G [Fodinicola acaciae]